MPLVSVWWENVNVQTPRTQTYVKLEFIESISKWKYPEIDELTWIRIASTTIPMLPLQLPLLHINELKGTEVETTCLVISIPGLFTRRCNNGFTSNYKLHINSVEKHDS